MRRLRTIDSYPMALVEDDQGKKALDWVLAAMHSVGVNKTILVGGYHIEKLVELYPHLHFYYDPEWQHSQSLHSLFKAKEELDEECIISHTNILFHGEALAPLLSSSGDIVVGAISNEFGPLQHYVVSPLTNDSGDVESDFVFSGLIRLSAKGASLVAQFLETLAAAGEENFLRNASFMDFIDRMRTEGVRINTVEITDSWSPVDANLNMAQFVLGSKSQTLERLQHRLKSAEILDQIRFSVADWRRDEKAMVSSIQGQFNDTPIVIRSSAHGEDSWQDSNAGKYHSALDVDTVDPAAITEAIENVISSFGDESDANRDKVFVQKFLSEIKVSGVLFTRDFETQAPYLVVNYDAVSGRSNTVTGGNGRSLATCYVFRGHEDRLDPTIRPLIPVIKEIQDLVDHDSLDIEFAIDFDDRCHILQVRPLTPKPGFSSKLDESDIHAELESASAFLKNTLGPHPLIQGSATLFSNMTDWNPAEIIGVTPRPLAASLYRYLITDDVWSKSRQAMGGRNVQSIPLMYIIGGHPFIDVRASLNSFIPASVSDDLTEKLVDYFIERIIDEPRLHDKVEFDVALTCMDFEFEVKARRLKQHGFEDEEIDQLREALKRQTLKNVRGEIQSFATSQDNLHQLAKRREAILAMKIEQPVTLCTAISMLLDDCRHYGTFTFANLARQGFIATLLLQSLHKIGVIDDSIYASLQASLPTVASDLANKLASLAEGNLSDEDFLAEFGHLRPGTYDILSHSYREQPDLYLSNLSVVGQSTHLTAEDGVFESLMANLGLDKICQQYDMGFTGDEMISFIRTAIPGREWGKFEFCKNLSAALVLIKKLGDSLGFSNDDMSMLPIWNILDARAESNPSSWQGDLKREIGWNRKAFNIAKTLRLPSVIIKSEDLFGFTESEDWPNFITNKSVTAPVLYLKGRNVDFPDFDGRIIAIEHSDPGYDWLFGHKIAGLVTKYGGVASHMSIRCAEFGLPAAIGCGERIFNSVSRSNVVELNCANRQISLVK